MSRHTSGFVASRHRIIRDVAGREVQVRVAHATKLHLNQNVVWADRAALHLHRFEVAVWPCASHAEHVDVPAVLWLRTGGGGAIRVPRAVDEQATLVHARPLYLYRVYVHVCVRVPL